MGAPDTSFLILSAVLVVAAAAWIFLKLRERRRAAAEKRAEPMRCSFCRKSREDVARLLHGPEAAICDECVRVCEGMLAEGREEDFSPTPPDSELPVN
jgi:ClpX C4-type zinc finger protein